jgi:hypothetical protein
VRFYQRHQFALLAPERARVLLETYWTVTPRQIESSVVLTNDRDWEDGQRQIDVI